MRISWLIVCLVMLGCDSGGFSPSIDTAERVGHLRYEASSLDGEPLLQGWMSVEVLTDSTIVGRWSIRWAPGADTTIEVGDQVGDGTLRGRQTGSGAYIDLNPGNADNNVILLPTPAEKGFAGTWYWSTITGPLTQGRFSALRD